MTVKIKFINGYTCTTKNVVGITGIDTDFSSGWVTITKSNGEEENINKDDVTSITITL